VTEPVVVLDASAVLALMHGARGQEVVAAALPGALLASVNLAEVVAKLVDRGMPAERAYAGVVAFGIHVAPFDADLAVLAGELRGATRSAGLSLGDRCCLALAQGRGAPVLTTEAAWEAVAAAAGVEVRNIRPRQ
jgi:ribonuclease VapC